MKFLGIERKGGRDMAKYGILAKEDFTGVDDVECKYKLSIEIMDIGPQEAKRILTGHHNYRNLSLRRVKAYSKEMEKGRWGLSIICFDQEGLLIDGATRLNAVIKAGRDIVFAVIGGWPATEVKFIDNGQTRTKGQVGQAERGVRNSSKIMAVVIGIDQMSSNTGRLILNAETLELYDKYGKLAEQVYFKLKDPWRSAITAIPFARAIRKFPDRKNDILDALDKLVTLNLSEPRTRGLQLFNVWTMKHKIAQKSGVVGRWEVYLRCARAIMAYLDNQPIDKLHCPSVDPFLL